MNTKARSSLPAVVLRHYYEFMSEGLAKGQRVVVSHLQGQEIGTVESVNYMTNKVLVYFDYEDCPHFDSFNLNQVTAYRPKLVDDSK